MTGRFRAATIRDKLSDRLNPFRQVIPAAQTAMMHVVQVIRSLRMRLRSYTTLAAETKRIFSVVRERNLLLTLE
jgi:hypothetical protein